MADNEQKAVKFRSTRPDISSLGGVVVAIGALLGGLILDGGRVSDVTQVTAAIIVLGGTLGAVMVTSPLSSLISAAIGLKKVFFEDVLHTEAAVDELVKYATKARKSSLISLESDLETIQDPFLKKALTLAVDGTDFHQLRQMIELDLVQSEKRAETEAKVFEAAGGYSPTIGIIGAVMGLIQVMKHLENIEEVGKGSAIAFVATVYGVAAANLLFLPAAAKLKTRAQKGAQFKELLIEGVGSILEGMNPKLIRTKLEAFATTSAKKNKPEAAKGAVEAAAEAQG
jgi:chemotaxis protein MotA